MAPGLQRLLVVLNSEPLERYLSNPTWGPATLQKLVRLSPIFLMSFTSSSRKWFSRKSQMWGSAWVEPRSCRFRRAWLRFFSMRRVASIASWVLPTHLEMASACPGRGHSYHSGFAFSRDSALLHFFLASSPKKWPTYSRATLSCSK